MANRFRSAPFLLTAFLALAAAACSSGSEPAPVAETVEVSPAEVTRQVGQTVQLVATVKDASGTVLNKALTWTSDRIDIATVSDQGLVTGSSEVTILGPCSTALSPAITVGQTVNGTLANTDCLLNDGSYADGYSIGVTAPTTVRIDMTSVAFDAWLVLLELLNDGSLAELAVNDDVDMSTTDSRIVFTLQPGRDYFILANSFEQPAFGAYHLSVALNTAIAGRVTGVMKPGKPPTSVLVRPFRPR